MIGPPVRRRSDRGKEEKKGGQQGVPWRGQEVHQKIGADRAQSSSAPGGEDAQRRREEGDQKGGRTKGCQTFRAQEDCGEESRPDAELPGRSRRRDVWRRQLESRRGVPRRVEGVFRGE